MKTKTPQTISQYKIIRELGQGAMGKVFLGKDESIERYVAIKTISIGSNSQTINEEYSKRFVQEAKSLAKCTHPNIVTILEFGQEKNMAFMVLEYIDGADLSQILSNQKGLSLMLVLSFFTQLLNALNASHKSNIIHRDIKPENILITKKRQLKLTDFGIAKTDNKDNLTQIGMTIGTPKYMAPEQLFSNDEIGTYTDIYSLFVLFYEMLGSVKDQHKYDFIAMPTIPQMAKHNNFNPTTRVPSCMVDFIDKGLKTTILDRYQTVSEVVQDLKPLLKILKKDGGKKQVESSSTLTQNNESIITNKSLDLEIDKETFNAIREQLSEMIGPISDLVITKSLQKTASKSDNKAKYDRFILSISEHIDNSDLKDKFINAWRVL
ncbi:MAG: serine/threonine-protein kinase [Marinicellaceae bacterium]